MRYAHRRSIGAEKKPGSMLRNLSKTSQDNSPYLNLQARTPQAMSAESESSSAARHTCLPVIRFIASLRPPLSRRQPHVLPRKELCQVGRRHHAWEPLCGAVRQPVSPTCLESLLHSLHRERIAERLCKDGHVLIPRHIPTQRAGHQRQPFPGSATAKRLGKRGTG